MKQFQAYANGSNVTRDTPREAAEAFFVAFPSKRKCNVIEGVSNGSFFVVTYGLNAGGEWPQSWKNVTKKTTCDLPQGASS